MAKILLPLEGFGNELVTLSSLIGSRSPLTSLQRDCSCKKYGQIVNHVFTMGFIF